MTVRESEQVSNLYSRLGVKKKEFEQSENKRQQVGGGRAILGDEKNVRETNGEKTERIQQNEEGVGWRERERWENYAL